MFGDVPQIGSGRVLRRSLGIGAALSIALLAMPAAAAGGSARYVLAVPVCKAATPGHAMCFAERLKTVPARTPGARLQRREATPTTGPAGGLTPGDLASAYHFSSTATGSGQKVAIIDWGNDATIAADLDTFDSQYGLASCTVANGCLSVLNQTGQKSPLPSDQGAADEISLDVEAVHSVCQLCKIDLIEVNSNAFSSTAAGVDEAVALGATEVSNSYGGADTSGPPPAALSAAYNHPGIVITVSTGDDGYYTFDKWIDTPAKGPAANPGAPNFPAELSTVVSVGGTSLYLNQTGGRQFETVWNENGPDDADEQIVGSPMGATGGGCSLFVNAQAWQTHVPDWSQTACGSKRLGADVAAVGDPYTGFDTYNKSDGGKGWSTIGGTSLAAPVIAAMYALAGGAHGVSYPSLTLYGHLGTSAVYDVTTGGNGFCGGEGAAQCGDPNVLPYHTVALGAVDCDFPAKGATPSTGNVACDAGPGYDGPSGVGTPNGLGVFAETGPTAAIAGPKSAQHGVSGTWTATTKDPFPAGAVGSYKWSWGDGTTSATTTGSDAHVYALAGPYSVTLTVTDQYGMKGTATYKVNIT